MPPGSGSLWWMTGSAEPGGPPNRTDPVRTSPDVLTDHDRRSLDVGLSLYHLALLYRLEGRTADERKIASEATRILEAIPRSDLVADVLKSLSRLQTPEDRPPA